MIPWPFDARQSGFRSRGDKLVYHLMRIGRKIGTWVAIAAAAGIILIFALPSYRQGEASIAGKRAEDFPLQVDGKPARLSDFRGKVVVLNFWASWCQPCVEEAQSLNRLQKRIAPRNAIIVGVAADENQAAYDKFLQDQAIVFPTYRDPGTKDQHSPIARPTALRCTRKPTSLIATERSPVN